MTLGPNHVWNKGFGPTLFVRNIGSTFQGQCIKKSVRTKTTQFPVLLLRSWTEEMSHRVGKNEILHSHWIFQKFDRSYSCCKLKRFTSRHNRKSKIGLRRIKITKFTIFTALFRSISIFPSSWRVERRWTCLSENNFKWKGSIHDVLKSIKIIKWGQVHVNLRDRSQTSFESSNNCH